MKYQQLRAEERVVIATLHKQGMKEPQIGQEMGSIGARFGGVEAQPCPITTEPTAPRGRTSGESQAQALAAQPAVWSDGDRASRGVVREWWSSKQISETLRGSGRLLISHETTYRHL